MKNNFDILRAARTCQERSFPKFPASKNNVHELTRLERRQNGKVRNSALEKR